MTKHETEVLRQRRSGMRYNFLRENCRMPSHFCRTGEPIPKESRAFPAQGDGELRKAKPCRYWSEGKGCTHPMHPRFTDDWKA